MLRGNIVRSEENRFGIRQGFGKGGRNGDAQHCILDRGPNAARAAHKAQILRPGVRRQCTLGETLGNQQRSLSGIFSRQPGELLDLHQLADERIAALDAGKQIGRDLLQRGLQS